MTPLRRRLAACTGFQWDEGNTGKNWPLHRVSDSESEEVFFNRPLIVAADTGHSSNESRFYALGITNAGRRLFIALTLRDPKIRVISAREMTRREERRYGQEKY